MAEQSRAQTPNQSSVTVVESDDELVQQDVRSVRLKLRKPKARKSVQWESGTVDNEHLNKKKSKCCCQYKKPRAFEESSSSSSSDECENCFGHVEKKKHKKHECDHASTSPEENTKEENTMEEPQQSEPANLGNPSTATNE